MNGPPAVGKPVVLTFVGNYLPGHKAGGTVRTVVNTVDHMCDEFEFRVVTRDRDLGDTQPYPGITPRHWSRVGNAQVYYLAPDTCTSAEIRSIIRGTPHIALYLNSFFDPLTVKALWNIRRGLLSSPRVVVAPRGEFAWASLGQKYPKKLAFMLAARLMGLYRDVIFHASSPFESADITKVMKIPPERIRVAFDFPRKLDVLAAGGAVPMRDPQGRLRVIFLSRIVLEKNLDYALRVLAGVTAPVVFDIHGPAENAAYWKQCQALIAQLPANVETRYCGPVAAGDVMRVFGEYELFLFPSGGEAYGHVIAESLLAGTPVLASTETAWRGLEADGMGWDLDLGNPEAFVAVIDRLAAVPYDERLRRRSTVQAGVASRLADPAILEANQRLFVATPLDATMENR
jgi:glycosyltransferase involved in cell wall biosynthesis